MQRRAGMQAYLLVLLIIFSSQASTIVSASDARSTQTWSGNIVVGVDYTIDVNDELIISACSSISMSSGVRIYVEGILTIEGTTVCPVSITSDGSGDHEGIQFNYTSRGGTSHINNLTIDNAKYGVTIWNSDPFIANLTLNNPDDVGIDLFDSANPTINDLIVFGAGQDIISPLAWRYGIGVSIGAESAPIIERAHFSQLKTSAINVWGDSTGMVSDVLIENVSGNALATVSGIWLENSNTIFSNITIEKAEYGVVIKHVDDDIRTSPVFTDLSISDATWKGLWVEKSDHSNFSNYVQATINGLNISGTGGPGSSNPGNALATIEINSTAVNISDAHLFDNEAVGLELYFVDSLSSFSDFLIENTGKVGGGAHSAGIAIRSSFFAANFDNIEVSGSPGPGVHSASGGGMQGNNWYLHDNGEDGLYLERSTVVVDGMILENNNESGAFVFDARYVLFRNLSSTGNDEAGLYYYLSNDLETSSGDVSCINCVSTGDQRGIIIRDSVDIWLDNIEVHDPIEGAAISVNNSGLSGSRGGRFNLDSVSVWSNNSGPAIEIMAAEGVFNGMDLYGNHEGLYWDGDHNLEMVSELSNANFSGSACLVIANHDQMTGFGNRITSDCNGDLSFIDSEVNWSALSDSTANHVLSLDGGSHLHLHKPGAIDFSLASLASGSFIEEAYDIHLWVTNNWSNGLPWADIDVSFSQLETTFSQQVDVRGYILLEDYIGRKWFDSGASSITEVTIDCSYDGVSNTTNITLDGNQYSFCILPLSNQAPVIDWQTPIDQSIFASGSTVIFNASGSRELENESMTFTWTSSLDGQIGTGSILAANDGSGSILNDGEHIITLEVCDASSNCASEQRGIELANQQPIVVVQTTPGLTQWGTLRLAMTADAFFDISGISDPEGDALQCSWDHPGIDSASVIMADCLNRTLNFFTVGQMNFDLILSVCDDINPCVEWVLAIELYNELPYSDFTITRDDNYSQTEVTLTSTTIDAEANQISYTWVSNLDGLLGLESTWSGHLSRGEHIITLMAGDDQPEHVNQTADKSTVLQVDDSSPRAIFSSPSLTEVYDSSDNIEFNGSDSGDWDSHCPTFPTGNYYCNPVETVAGNQFLIVSWSSDVDGVLRNSANNSFIFNHHLSAGLHNITMAIDDGVNPVVRKTVQIDVDTSAPILVLAEDLTIKGYHSDDIILIDARNSMDADGDSFTMTLTSDIMNDIILSTVSTDVVHQITLAGGVHQLTFNLTDESGKSRVVVMQVEVIESDPHAVIYSPNEAQYFDPGQALLLDSNGTTDADDDITFREWRLWNGMSFTRLSESASYETTLEPGPHHISLYVEDRRGGSDEAHVNITLGYSSPRLSNLEVDRTLFVPGELASIMVSVKLDDADGTTNVVIASITHGIQTWDFNLSDENDDGIWTGTLDFRPDAGGRPYLKVTAIDGEGDNAKTDSITLEMRVEISDDISSALVYTSAGISGLLLVGIVTILFILRKKKKLADLEMIDDWGVFGMPADDHEKTLTDLPEEAIEPLSGLL